MAEVPLNGESVHHPLKYHELYSEWLYRHQRFLPCGHGKQIHLQLKAFMKLLISCFIHTITVKHLTHMYYNCWSFKDRTVLATILSFLILCVLNTA